MKSGEAVILNLVVQGLQKATRQHERMKTNGQLKYEVRRKRGPVHSFRVQSCRALAKKKKAHPKILTNLLTFCFSLQLAGATQNSPLELDVTH